MKSYCQPNNKIQLYDKSKEYCKGSRKSVNKSINYVQGNRVDQCVCPNLDCLQYANNVF